MMGPVYREMEWSRSTSLPRKTNCTPRDGYIGKLGSCSSLGFTLVTVGVSHCDNMAVVMNGGYSKDTC